MRWSDFVKDEPSLAELGRQRLVDPGVLLVGTLRLDGSARISPVEPLLWERDLWLSMLFGSRKARDLLRDPRVLVHSIVTNRDGAAGEFKVRGRAVEESDRAVQEGYAEQIRNQFDWDPVPGKFHLFWVDIEDVTFIRYEDATGDQFVARWPSKREFVRRGTSATTLGDPQAHHEVLGQH
ncbi:MAG: pyridoxamine 5'-phosphate oxidase family protein [Acidimicrobiales bacterium]